MFSYGDKRHEKINLISLSSGKQYRKNRTKLIMIFLLYFTNSFEIFDFYARHEPGIHYDRWKMIMVLTNLQDFPECL